MSLGGGSGGRSSNGRGRGSFAAILFGQPSPAAAAGGSGGVGVTGDTAGLLVVPVITVGGAIITLGRGRRMGGTTTG